MSRPDGHPCPCRDRARSSFLLACRGLALQDQADEFGLAPRSGLIEHVREVGPGRCQRDAKPVRRCLQPITFHYLARKPRFRRGQPEILAEPLLANRCSLLRIGNEQDCRRAEDIDPVDSSKVRYDEYFQRSAVPAGEPEVSADAAKLAPRTRTTADELA